MDLKIVNLKELNSSRDLDKSPTGYESGLFLRQLRKANWQLTP